MNKKVILITGTNSGFGWLTAQSCAALGYKVYATMRDVAGRNREKATQLASHSPNIEVIDLELTDPASAKKVFGTILNNEGRIDVLINNAGVYAVGLAETFTDTDIAEIIDINLVGPWRLIRAALPRMRQQGEGLIINVSSVSARFSFPFQAPYSTAKFALEGLSEGLHYEVRPFGVDVALVQPGPFPTEIFGKIWSGSDPSVAEAYGEMAKAPQNMGAGISRMFENLKPNPQAVADAITGLIAQPRGGRALRTVVNPLPEQFTERANDKVQEEFSAFLTTFGMQDLLH
jgi:NAD(P)-dependent dehydrogenase (short-subunit alcohol dehydrogenase family)